MVARVVAQLEAGVGPAPKRRDAGGIETLVRVELALVDEADDRRTARRDRVDEPRGHGVERLRRAVAGDGDAREVVEGDRDAALRRRWRRCRGGRTEFALARPRRPRTRIAASEPEPSPRFQRRVADVDGSASSSGSSSGSGSSDVSTGPSPSAQTSSSSTFFVRCEDGEIFLVSQHRLGRRRDESAVDLRAVARRPGKLHELRQAEKPKRAGGPVGVGVRLGGRLTDLAGRARRRSPRRAPRPACRACRRAWPAPGSPSTSSPRRRTAVNQGTSPAARSTTSSGSAGRPPG